MENRNFGEAAPAQSRVMESGMQFLDWRINELSLSSNPQPRLAFGKPQKGDRWDISLRFYDVRYLVEDNVYLSSLGAAMKLVRPLPRQENASEILFTALGTITGIFRLLGDVDESQRERLLLRQTPAILLPFLRAALGNIMAATGFGVEPFPLVNIYDTLKDKTDLKIVQCEADPEG